MTRWQKSWRLRCDNSRSRIWKRFIKRMTAKKNRRRAFDDPPIRLNDWLVI